MAEREPRMAGHAELVICEQSIEQTLSWMNRFRWLKVRYERREDIHQAFLDLGCALIC
jgi:hypothetical protein